MKYKLCVSLTESSTKACIDFVRFSNSDLIEHRIDFMDRIDSLADIYDACSKPIIATCRSQIDGGRFHGTEENRVDLLLNAVTAGASYVDIEVDTNPQLFAHVREKADKEDCRLILSKHYHSHTPNDSVLLSMLDRLDTSGGHIIKLVSTPRTTSDCLRVLQLYSEEKKPNLPLVAFGMGTLGRFTRVSALVLGAPFMYVSQDSGEAAAAGQVSLSDMRAIMEVLQ
ncbi:MAG: type I 3-dehydroquinate dehydratase [Candidatus Hermodarchaeota archaeon]